MKRLMVPGTPGILISDVDGPNHPIPTIQFFGSVAAALVVQGQINQPRDKCAPSVQLRKSKNEGGGSLCRCPSRRRGFV